MFKTWLVCFVVSLMLINCKSKPEVHEIIFTPVEDIHYRMDSVATGTPLTLIVYSGGQPSTDNAIYYYQFLAVNKSNADTLRILSALISTPGENITDKKTYTPTSQYDPVKGLNDAVFYPEDSTNELAIQLITNDLPGNEKENLKAIEDIISKKKTKRKFVAVNKSMDIFERDYKTVFGVLHFKETPW